MNAPFFVAAHPEEPEGADYLGLRAINLAMMGRLLPGINNVVQSVRPFSLMCWIAWQHLRGCQDAGVDATAETFTVFREKVELAYVWSHVEAGQAMGMPGNQQSDPGEDPVTLTFKAFSRRPSYLDAVQYGPALKTDNGLEFLYIADGFVQPTEAGEELAQAFDQHLMDHLEPHQYQFLADIRACTTPRKTLKAMCHAWLIDDPTPGEQELFRRQYYRPELLGESLTHANRAAMLFLVMTCLEESGKLNESPDVELVRRRLAAWPLPRAAREHPAAEMLHCARRYWQMLHVRQAQRLALEALFGWVERCLASGEATSAAGLTELMLLSFKKEEPETSFDDGHVRRRLEHFARGGVDVDELYAAGEQDEEFSIFMRCQTLEDRVRNVLPEAFIPLPAFELLLQCVAYVEAMQHDEFAKARLKEGPGFRLPLGPWAATIVRLQDLPLRDFLRKLIETFVLSQHLGIAAARSRDERSRLRISVEDKGLTSLLMDPSKVLVPVRSQDRLASAMALMQSCGLIVADQHPRQARGDGPYYSIA